VAAAAAVDAVGLDVVARAGVMLLPETPLPAMAPLLVVQRLVRLVLPLVVVHEAAAGAVVDAAADEGRLPKQLLQHPKPLWRQRWRRPRLSDTCGLPKQQAMQCTTP
jgi:hypothetical protein